MEEDIAIGIQMGNVTFSFKTDQKGSNLKATVKAIKEIVLTHASLFKSLGSDIFGKAVAGPEVSSEIQPRRKGKGETTLILNRLEEVLIPKNYFKTARTTGDVKVERIVAVDDCGNVVNPLIVEGQVHGGIAQAFGQAMVERVKFDVDGQLLTGSLGDYALPRADDMPRLVLGHTVTPTPLNPLGAKGVGEAGTNGCPPAIANAVIDALAPLGIRHLDLPYSSDRVWEAVQAASH